MEDSRPVAATPSNPTESTTRLPNNPHSRAAAVAVRIAFTFVFIINVQCAISFVLWSEAYAPQFELAGVAGSAAVCGLGVAFLMWNATYPAVIINPRRFRALAVVVIVQQTVGLVGESWILLTLPAGHEVLAASIIRFIAFDGAGLVLMAFTFAWLAIADRASKTPEIPPQEQR